MICGGSHIAVGLIDEKWKIIDFLSENLSSEEKITLNQNLVPKILEHISQILQRNTINFGSIQSIGVACPGTIQNGMILKSGNLKLRNFPLQRMLEEKLNMPVTVRNDAKCAGLAEKQIGSLKECQDAVFLTLGTGIGGAVFMKGKLLTATNYSGFEIGHMVINKNGRLCTCGKRGCLETYCSMKALKETIRREYGLGQDVHSQELLAILANHSDKSEKILQEYLNDLTVGLGNLVDFFEPEIISIGGSFAYYKTLFLPILQEKLMQDHVFFNERKDIKLTVAELQNNAGMIGAVI